MTTLKGGSEAIQTDNPPSPGKVGSLLFSNSGVGSFMSHKDQINESTMRRDLWCFSLFKRKRYPNHLQITLQRHHFLLFLARV